MDCPLLDLARRGRSAGRLCQLEGSKPTMTCPGAVKELASYLKEKYDGPINLPNLFMAIYWLKLYGTEEVCPKPLLWIQTSLDFDEIHQ